MVAIVRTNWAGTTGGPGLTQLVIGGSVDPEWGPGNAQTAVNAVRVFWDALKAYLPNELVLTVSPVVDWYNRETGELQGSTTAATTPLAVGGTGAGVYAGGSGFKVTWETGQIRNGRRVRGNTYVVPTDSAVFNSNGGVSSTVRTAVASASNTMIASLASGGAPLMVWSRPREATETVAYRAGYATQVNGAVCSAKSAILRGRRD